MRWVRLDPPGTICVHASLEELLRGLPGSRFLEVGVGRGETSLRLLRMGYRGVGIDFSRAAIRQAAATLAPYLARGDYRLIEGDFLADPLVDGRFDVALALFVMEHVEDDERFLGRLLAKVRPGGSVVLALPAGHGRWSIEDETVGHLRRYERRDLEALAGRVGAEAPTIWSVAVPTANLLFGLGNLLLRRSAETAKRAMPAVEQTRASGLQEIPFKTLFPSAFRLLLNRGVLSPALLVQRLFYRTDWGVNLLARFRRPDEGRPESG
jgi:SAM-dependent methyltransferase